MIFTDKPCGSISSWIALQVIPGSTHGPILRREGHDALHPPHVEEEAALGRDLPAHAEASAADRDRPRVAAHQLADLVDRPGGDHPRDGDGIQLGDVVHDHRVGRHGDRPRQVKNERERDDRGEPPAAHARLVNTINVFLVGSPAWSRSPRPRSKPIFARYRTCCLTEVKFRTCAWLLPHGSFTPTLKTSWASATRAFISGPSTS